MQVDNKAILRTIFQYLLGKSETDMDVNSALNSIANDSKLQAQFEQLITLLQSPEEASWLEAIAAARDGVFTSEVNPFLEERTRLQAQLPELLALYDALTDASDTTTEDFLAELPSFPTFAAQWQASNTETTSKDGWIEISLKYGQAWQDALTQQWKQLNLPLANLLQGHSASPVVQGLMNDDAPASNESLGHLQVTPDEANFEISLSLLPDRANEHLCQLSVTITLYDRLGDFSGIAFTLSWGNTVYRQLTDEQGQVIFAELPRSDLENMSLLVTLPEE